VDSHTRAYLDAPSPLVDPALRVDGWVGARLAADGGLLLRTASGDEVPAVATSPAPGVLRVQIGDTSRLPDPSPMLVDGLPASPVRLAADGDMVRLTADGVEATFGPGGLEGGGLALPTAFTSGVLLRGAEPVGFVQAAALAPDERVYGGGEAFQGPDLRGRIRRGVNLECHGVAGTDASYLTVPLFWTDGGWGLFAHTGAPVTADLGATHADVAAIAVPGRGADLFVLSGEPLTMLQQYVALTGRPGRFPEWAFGVWTSRCSYLSASEVEQVVSSYADADCPLDVVHVDAWVKGNVIKDLTCSWEVDRARFPVGWAEPLLRRGVRTSLWHNSFVLPGTPAGDELLAAGLVLRDDDGDVVGTNDMPERIVIDFTDPKAVEWWHDKVLATATAEGNVSFKADFAEEVPPTAVTADGRTGWEVRNEYAVRYQRATYDGLREVLGTDEIAMFCRSGTAGAQRYPCHWVGDTPSTWSGLASALRAQLSLSLSGFGLVASDIGGFYTPDAFVHTAEAFEAMDPASYVADVEPELFARWAQLGAVSPVMRFHGTGRREPWAYPGAYGEAAVAACRLRAGLRGYLKAAADEAATTGTPMMRPMVLACPGDRAARDAELQYLLGPDILVAPILEPGGRVRVYNPGGRWDPLAGLPRLETAGWQELVAPLDGYPVWRRA
jgi:alpha-D-xyloside xylohydrolase